MGYDVILRDHSTERVADADAFVHERTMTTFYRTGNERHTVDCWSAAVAAVRTDEILMIRRVDTEAAAELRHLMSV